MNVFSFHLASCGIITTLSALVRPPNSDTVPGLMHAECMIPMTLGRPVALPSRYRPHQIAVLAGWDHLVAPFGQKLANEFNTAVHYHRTWLGVGNNVVRNIIFNPKVA